MLVNAEKYYLVTVSTSKPQFLGSSSEVNFKTRAPAAVEVGFVKQEVLNV